MIKYLKGDITKLADKNALVVHGVNCQHAMGSGVAKAIKEKWPIVYTRFMEEDRGHKMLGHVTFVPVDSVNNITVANAYTQEFYGREKKRYADTTAINTALLTCCQHAQKNDLSIYVPKIGCGLGGLSWIQDVLPIFETHESQFNLVDIYVCDL